jgi:hypothetical protein
VEIYTKMTLVFNSVQEDEGIDFGRIYEISIRMSQKVEYSELMDMMIDGWCSTKGQKRPK